MGRIGALALGLALLASCGADFGVGLSGCGGGPAFETTRENTVPGAATVALTAAGVDVLIAQREALVGRLLGVDDQGWVRLEVPRVELGTRGGRLGVGLRDLALGFDLRAVDLALEVLPDPARLRVTVAGARLRLDDGVVWITVGGDAACRLGNDLEGGTPRAAAVEVDFAFDLALRVDAEGRLQAEVTVLPFTLHGLGLRLIYDPDLPECADGRTASECRLACGAGDLALELAQAVRALFAEALDTLAQPVVQRLVDAVAEAFTAEPLAVEGVLHPRLLAALLPTAADSLPLSFKGAPSPAGITVRAAGDAGDGLGLTFDVGLASGDHPCVPPVGAPPPLRPGPAPTLSGFDHTGAPYAVGLSLSDAVVNRAAWVAYRAGTLCAALDTDQILALTGQQIDTGSLSLVLPGLRALTLGPRPVLIGLDPRFTPEDLPLARFFPVEDDGGVPQAGLRLRLPRLGLSFYGLVEERFARLFAAEADLVLDLVIQAGPDDRLLISVAQPELLELRQTYNELLSGADLPALLALITDLATSTLLADGLQLDLGLRGLVPALTGLPLELTVAALRVDGESGDFLSVLMGLEAAGASLRPRVETHAELLAAWPGGARLAVSAAGAAAARYQWRLAGGAWRPLRRAPGGVLEIQDGRLAVLGPQRVEIRAVAEGDPASLDPHPAAVDWVLEPPAPAGRAPAAPAGAGRCTARPGVGGGGPAGLLLALLLALRLARRRARAGLLLLLLGGGCGDPAPAAEALACARDGDCPGGLFCLEGRCDVPDLCEDSADCCPGAECRGGVCLAPAAACGADADCGLGARCAAGRCLRAPCDGGCPAGTACIAGRCHQGPPCRAACAPGEVCFPDAEICRPAPPACAACPPGELALVTDPERFAGPRCDLSDARCTCVRAPALVPADYGRHARMALRDGAPVFAAWDADYGDLVFVTGVEAGAPQVSYLDGVPEGVAPAADPTGPRGGVVAPGPDRGRYASLAVDGKGRAHVAYYDADAGSLRALRQTDDRTGWLPPVVVDADGDVGRYPALVVDSAHRPRILYHVTRSRTGRAGLRLAWTDAEAFAEGAIRVEELVSLPADGEPPPPGVTPALPGVRPCARLGQDGRIYAAWYDGARRWPSLAVGRPGEGFQVAPIAGALDPADLEAAGGRYDRLDTHDLGRFCAIAFDPRAGTPVVALSDSTTDALLLYRGPVGAPGIFEVVDPGGGGARRRVGPDPALALAPDGRAVIVYQDATENDLYLTAATPGGGFARPVRLMGRESAVGFYNNLVLVGDQAVVGTLELRTLPDGRGAHRLRVVRSALP